MKLSSEAAAARQKRLAAERGKKIRLLYRLHGIIADSIPTNEIEAVASVEPGLLTVTFDGIRYHLVLSRAR